MERFQPQDRVLAKSTRNGLASGIVLHVRDSGTGIRQSVWVVWETGDKEMRFASSLVLDTVEHRAMLLAKQERQAKVNAQRLMASQWMRTRGF